MKIFTVSQISRIIKDLIDNEVVLEDIIVTGELSSFSITRNIAYFTLKDSENMLNCVQFSAKSVYNIGDLVECRGNIKYYPKGGKLTFNVFSIQPCGQGELYKRFLLLKDKLEKEGLFDAEHKIPLPRFVNSIGVVTSKTGAVLQDIKNITARRNPNLEIYVYDAQVQGNYAVEQVIEGISYFDNFSDVDVIIVARGGGSVEDLSPFNDEKLARIAYICNKPIISAVGHETDYTILDFVADMRAPTPSAAAELVSYDLNELKQYIESLNYTMFSKVKENFDKNAARVNSAILEIENQINGLVHDNILYVSDLYNNLNQSINQTIQDTKYRVDSALNTLDKLNPTKLLKSGYSYVTNKNMQINDKNTAVGDMVQIVADSVKFTAQIKSKEKFDVRKGY